MNSKIKSRSVKLEVVTPEAIILATDEHRIEQGSLISLVCILENLEDLLGICFNIYSVPEKIEDPQDIRLKLRQTEKQLQEQIEANRKLNLYIGNVLANVMASSRQDYLCSIYEKEILSI